MIEDFITQKVSGIVLAPLDDVALAKPVVTARTPAVGEFFEHGRDIYLCDSARPDSLAEAVLALKDAPGLRETIALNGYELVWEKFSPAVLGTLLLKKMATYPKRGATPNFSGAR